MEYAGNGVASMPNRWPVQRMRTEGTTRAHGTVLVSRIGEEGQLSAVESVLYRYLLMRFDEVVEFCLSCSNLNSRCR